ncbi:hypothetical protein Trydic_g11006 [Trypoxylus dichotomus]
MFRFNFCSSEPEEYAITNYSGSKVALHAREISLNELDFTQINTSNYNNYKCRSGVTIKYLGSDSIVKNTQENQHNTAVFTVTNHSDLEEGVYEGGFKVWECTQDLVNFMCTKDVNLKNKTVLDLGCGAGIIGIFCLLEGAHVYFQDYNPEVILSATIPNILLNFGNVENFPKTSKFYSGDWEYFLTLIRNDNIKFDFILTSETIYNIDNYRKLYAIFINCLKETGVIYVAAKTHYFGVGGGLRTFEELLASLGELNIETSWICSNGINREIIKLTKKHRKVVH